jgi:hypothetical protein
MRSLVTEASSRFHFKPYTDLPANDNLQQCVVEAASGPAELQAGGAVQRVFSIRHEAEAGAACGGEGGVPLRGVVSPRGFIVTNLGTSSRAVVRFYNERGTAEQWIKEGKRAVAMTRLSNMRAITGCYWPRGTDAAAVWRHAAEDRNAAFANWKGGLQGAANFGDDLVAEGNVSAESIGK